MPLDLRAIIDDYEELPSPVLYHRGQLWSFELAANGPHRFGGPLPAVSGVTSDATLHALITLNPTDDPLIVGFPSTSIPLVFPFQHEGGRLTYKIQSDGSIAVTDLNPATADAAWPYDDYPKAFPALALAASPAIPGTLDDLERLVCQSVPKLDEFGDGQDEQLACLIVPPSDTYGVSLWGPDGDAERVQCVFTINMRTGVVDAENQCS